MLQILLEFIYFIKWYYHVYSKNTLLSVLISYFQHCLKCRCNKLYKHILNILTLTYKSKVISAVWNHCNDLYLS